MMFYIHSVFSLELMALVSGVALLILIKNQAKIKNLWLNFAAWFVIVVSSLSIICSAYYAVSSWNKGYFEMHRAMMKYDMMKKNEDMNKKDEQRH